MSRHRQLRRLARQWVREYAEKQAATDAALAERITDGRRGAVLVGGPRDGAVVRLEGRPLEIREAVATPVHYVRERLAAQAAPVLLPERRYRLEQRATGYHTGDPLQPYTDDRDLDEAAGWRYRLVP